MLALGVIAFMAAYFGGGPKQPPERISNKPAFQPSTPKTVPVPKEARRVAGKFILTAVARKNLGESWTLAHPELKAGMTRREWLTGNIPVVPFRVESLDLAPFKVDWSYPNNVGLRVAMLPKKGSGAEPQIFFIELKAVGSGTSRRWLVSYWAPYESVPVRAGEGR